MVKENIRDLLKSYGLKITPVRLQVLSVLLDSNIALSHADITESLGDSTIDKVTLYRTLNIFEKTGLIHKVANEERNWLYALHLADAEHDEHQHAHFICDACEKIFCFDMDYAFNEQINDLAEGFIIKQKEVRLHGLCPTCN